jgi:hypothetical protein
MTNVRQIMAGADHWHLIGDRWRPLHEQLAALQDAATWTSVSASVVTTQPFGTGPVTVSQSFGLASALHNGDYGLLVVTGVVSAVDIVEVRAQLHDMLAARVRHLVVDLSTATSADPGLRAALDRTFRRLRAVQGTLTLFDVPDRLIPMLGDGPLRTRVAVCGRPAVSQPYSRTG